MNWSCKHPAYRKGLRVGKAFFRAVLLAVAFLPSSSLNAAEETKTVIGAVEEVILLPWGVKLPARIDTGASMTSLGVHSLPFKDNKVAQFTLPGNNENIRVELPASGTVEFVLRSQGSADRGPRSNSVGTKTDARGG